MIIWLASYPRSGNTLLRTIIHQKFGLPGYADEQGPDKHVDSPEAIRARAIVGGRRHRGTRDEFYRRASDSDELFLVKTHREPLDGQPAIHVVRDGRKASHSYFLFLEKFFPEAKRSLLEVLVGNDAYGHWSSHYEAWSNHSGRRLELRFEDLVNPAPSVIEAIASFIERDPKDGCAWQNPFSELQRQAPDFFREGRTAWDEPDEWGLQHESAFWVLHGELMQRLGYGAPPEDIWENEELVRLAESFAKRLNHR